MDEEQRREFRRHSRLFSRNNYTILFQNRHIEDMEVNFVRQKLATDDKIKGIEMIRCQFQEAQFQRLIDILKNNKNVETFICNGSHFLEEENRKDFTEFINILLKGDNNISRLGIRRMDIGGEAHYNDDRNYKNYEEFVELLKNNKTLKYLDISDNDLTFEDIKYLIDELEDNDTLQELVFQSGMPSRREKETKLEYYLAINDVYRQLKKGGEVIIENNELRELVNSLFLSFSVRNAATGKMTDIIPPELKYEIAKNFVLELKNEK